MTQLAPQICTSEAAPKQGMCKHMSDAGGGKDGNAGAVKNQFSNLLGYNARY
ncbi:MAG TPA: hypothetical protein VLG49_05170 [Rhabdochlamydiaceae bacterium]|nr:hypothetical protein [Rhabdochlamydiaceae bacterium]